ncbi:MAG TPA: sialidase family protein [Pyrinomonadaceae bacterium]|nr:sialidase family protein [Pyrinomonadaceae bacterium]
MKKPAIITAIALALLLAGCAQQTRQETIKATPGEPDSPKPVRVSAEGADAAEPSIAPGADGTIYVAWVEHRENKEADVMLAHVDRDGQAKGSPVRVNPNTGEATAWRGDPPTVAVAPDGTIYVGWTARIADVQGHANDLYLSASRDAGKTFGPPVKVNDDGKKVTHAMHSLAVGADGRVYVVWLDERNVVMPPPGKGGKMEHMEANREVFFASSDDGGRSFGANQRLGQEACPCCKTAVAASKDGRVYASWRQVLPGEFRHIALAASTDGGKTFSKPTIVSDDRWMTASCPVSGPALSTAQTDGALRVVWYTEGDKGEPGLYWAESRDDGKTFSESKPFAKGQARGNPYLLANAQVSPTVIWESNATGSPRVMSAPLANEAAVSTLANTGELPAAALSGDRLFVGYISKVNDRRSIWVVRRAFWVAQTKPAA